MSTELDYIKSFITQTLNQVQHDSPTTLLRLRSGLQTHLKPDIKDLTSNIRTNN